MISIDYLTIKYKIIMKNSANNIFKGENYVICKIMTLNNYYNILIIR